MIRVLRRRVCCSSRPVSCPISTSDPMGQVFQAFTPDCTSGGGVCLRVSAVNIKRKADTSV